jgi:hypothetical protein
MLIRHCALCNKEIQVSLPYDNSYVYYKTKRKWYHADCFTAIATDRIINGGWFGKTKDFVLQEVSKDNLYRFFVKHYQADYIPPNVWKRINGIYNGTEKGLAQPIPPHELLDIIERKESYLDKQFVRKGITDSTQKINYALTTACGSYKSYKEWRAGLEAEQAAAVQAEADRQYSAAFTRMTKHHPTESAKEDMFIDLEDDD